MDLRDFKEIEKLLPFLISVVIGCIFVVVGTRNHTSLSEDAIPSGRDTDRFEGRRWDHRETCQKPTKTDYIRAGREISEGIESREICRVLCFDTG